MAILHKYECYRENIVNEMKKYFFSILAKCKHFNIGAVLAKFKQSNIGTIIHAIIANIDQVQDIDNIDQDIDNLTIIGSI